MVLEHALALKSANSRQQGHVIRHTFHSSQTPSADRLMGRRTAISSFTENVIATGCSNGSFARKLISSDSPNVSRPKDETSVLPSLKVVTTGASLAR